MLFINPVLDKISQPKIVKKFTYACFPTSIGFLSGYLRAKNGASIRILDEQIKEASWQILEDELGKLGHPKIVGIPNLTATTKRVIRLTEEIKAIDPKATIVLGGVHATVLPEDMLRKSQADIVVRKEGEVTLSEVYDCIKQDRDYSGIKGISYKKGSDVFHNPDRELLEDLDDIPPFPYDLFEGHLDRYADFGTIISSRGCPFDCIFCSQRAISGNAYRFFSVNRVVNDIKTLVDFYGQKKIWFIDDSLTINKKRLYELIDGIIASGYHKKVAFIGTTRGKEVTYEMLERLKACNFISMAFGVETGSERLMKVIDKKELVEDNIKAIKMCHEMGILTDASLIFGLPTETRKERYDTLKLMCDLPLDGARFNIAIPYPGTKLYRIAKEENSLHIHENWTNCCNQYYLQGDDLPYVPEGTRGVDLIFDTIFANIAFYLRPKILYKTLFKSPLSGGGVLSLPKRWYVKPDILFSLAAFLCLVIWRIAFISAKALFNSIFNIKEKRANEIRV
ncbi:MAG: B12-binding domain-containing radical SAM protein [Candidatus Omnitrophica bacterium]|nr:B12-binding domain-containing radical SAM protein [Candidatus Omnitrophota bacterium]MCM8790588.1 B12-binding domain-containing radical SAM protein [Candidatus Omnitrophota bacterium]